MCDLYTVCVLPFLYRLLKEDLLAAEWNLKQRLQRQKTEATHELYSTVTGNFSSVLPFKLASRNDL